MARPDLHVSVRYCRSIVTKVGGGQKQKLAKLLNIKCNENLFRSYRVVTCGQADRHGEANRGVDFLKFSLRMLRNQASNT
jgi:hypothetical protein